MNIILYSNGCPMCKTLERKLNSKGIEYTKFSNVEKMLAMGIKNVPVLEVDGTRLTFEKALTWIKEYDTDNEY